MRALVVDHDAELTSEVLRAFVKSMGSCLIVGSAYHKNTNAKMGALTPTAARMVETGISR